jgi:hypothetical protein
MKQHMAVIIFRTQQGESEIYLAQALRSLLARSIDPPMILDSVKFVESNAEPRL